MVSYSLSKLSSALNEVEPLATQIADLKKSVQEQEAKALDEILKRVWLLLPVLAEGKQETYHRDQISLIEREERMQTAPNEGFTNRSRLVFYEDQRLVLVHDVTYWGSTSRVRTISEEFELSCSDAIRSFGLESIASGILKAIQTADSLVIIKGEMQDRLQDVSRALEILGCTQ